MKIFLVLIMLSASFAFSQSNIGHVEKSLMQACSKRDLQACQNLAAFYVKNKDWDNALLLGEALCSKDITIGCTFAGMALTSKNKAKEGLKLLNLACDKFEPFACRSLGRLMKSADKKDLSHLYFRRACHYGLSEICGDLKKDKKILSKAGSDLLKKIPEVCSDTKSSLCSDQLNTVQKCTPPLSKEDCELLPGFLSIFFRAKLIQAESKLLLNRVLVAEKKLKQDPKIKSYTFDMNKILKEVKTLEGLHYVFGFMQSCSGKEAATSLDLFPKSYEHLSAKVISTIRNEFSKGKAKDCYKPEWGFEAFAIASLDPLSPSHLDVWKINQDGDIIHLKEGIPSQQ